MNQAITDSGHVRHDQPRIHWWSLMKLLIAGGSEVDAGKTTFTTGLIARTGICGFKPRAGNDYWYDYDAYQQAAKDGRLYGKDANQIAAVSPGAVSPETINPVHRLWLPTPGRGKGPLGRRGRRFVIDRVTVDGNDHYIRNGDVSLPPRLSETYPLAEAPVVESLTDVNDIMASLHSQALDALERSLEQRDAGIVESYSDIARPLVGFIPDAVAVIEPRRCRVYDGSRFAKACDVASGSAHEGRLEERVDHVIELLDSEAEVSLPVLSSSDRLEPATVADAYEAAYDALLAAV